MTIVAQAVADGVPVVSAQPSAEWEVAGVNSKVQLAELERVHQREVANTLLEQGPDAAADELDRYLTASERSVLGAFARMGHA